jgi:phage repressor protein C with HTH and peptisase S24 domain
MALGKNIEKFRLAKELSPLQLSEKTNHLVSVDAIKRLEERDSSSSKFTAEIARALGVSVSDLLDEAYATSINEEVSLINNDEYPSIKRVNLKLSAGIVGFGIDYDVEDKTPIVMQREWFRSRGFKPANLLAIKVKGDSMQPGLYEGDTVVINTADHTPIDGQVYAINYEGEMLIKRMVRDAGVWWLSSDNQDQRKHPRKECNSDLCIIIGKVVHKQSEVI